MNFQNSTLQLPKRNSKNLKRVSSSTNLHLHNKMKNSIFPSLKNSAVILVSRKKSLNNSAGKKNHYKIEIEKLYDQNVHYKKTIKKLQSDINEIKNELNQKQKLLNSMNNEIENIIKENKDETEFNKDPIQLNEQGRYTLIKKMKNRIKEAEKGLNKEIQRNQNLKKDKKYTKFKELEIEKKIINEQNNKILSLIENSLEMKSNHDKELYESGVFNNNLESQKNIIYNFMQKFEELNNEEKNLQDEIAKYEKILSKTNNRVKIIKLKQISLQDQNKKLTKEKEEFITKNKDQQNNSDNKHLLENLKRKLSSAKSEYNYNRLKSKKTNEKLDNIKKNFEQNIEQFKKIENNLSIQKDNRSKDDRKNQGNNNAINTEEYINKLKEIYQENREKENELEKHLFLYQEAIQKMNNGENVNIDEIRNNILKLINKVDTNNRGNSMNMDFVLSESNPYYSNIENNEPLSTGKFTNEQFGQFTYILFKNFEAKGIDYEKAKNEIISPLTNFYKINNTSENKNEIQEKLGTKFSEIILNLLNCNNENDRFRLKIYFNALYFDILINSEELNESTDKMELIVNYFLSLFNYIHIYTEKEKENLKKRLISKNKEQILKLNNLLKEYMKNNKDNKGYISLKEMKYILDSNNDIKLREKYIEFIIYFMKQFEDENASLFDLKVEMIQEPLVNNDNNVNNANNNDNSNNNENIDYNEHNENNNDNIQNINISNQNKSNSNNNINNKSNEKSSNNFNNNNNNNKNITDSNESVEEVSPEVYNKNINDVLILLKQIIINENKNFREIFADSIVKINNPETDIITLESFAAELNKRNIKLNYLQLSCFNYKYCINNELHALEIEKIENDINNLKENVIQKYEDSPEIPDNN